jgi:hypothetical protein
MGKSRGKLRLVPERCYESSMTRAWAAADASAMPFLAGVQAAIEMAEADPKGARDVLWRLQGDWRMLERLERTLGGRPTEAILRLGAAIHAARAELASAEPEPNRCLDELLGWLYGPCMSAA